MFYKISLAQSFVACLSLWLFRIIAVGIYIQFWHLKFWQCANICKCRWTRLQQCNQPKWYSITCWNVDIFWPLLYCAWLGHRAPQPKLYQICTENRNNLKYLHSHGDPLHDQPVQATSLVLLLQGWQWKVPYISDLLLQKQHQPTGLACSLCWHQASPHRGSSPPGGQKWVCKEAAPHFCQTTNTMSENKQSKSGGRKFDGPQTLKT